MAALLILVGLLGLAVGSFLNVVIHRVPRGESLLRPPSRCPSCEAAIRPWHNVPVLGWVVLRGRCASCGAPIGVRYPLVEALTAVVFVAVTARLVNLGLGSAVPAYLWFSAVGIALAIIDLEHRRLPTSIVLPSYVVVGVLLAGSAAWQHDWWSLVRAVIGAVVLFGFFLAIALIYPAGMGFGDVRLSGLLGGVLAYVSWATLIVGAFAGFFLGAVIGVAVIAAGRGGRRTALPFGPFMILGGLLALWIAQPVADLLMA